MAAMRRPFDPTDWPRRAAFEFFRGFDKPWFNVCTRVDVTALRPALAVAGTGSLTLALHHAALALANALEPFRLRLQGGQLWLYDVVHAGTTVLRPDGSFGFAYLDHHPQFPAFAAAAAPALAAARDAPDSFAPRSDAHDLIHCTSLPWLHFTSFSHARRWGGEDAIPKIAFGRIDAEPGSGRHWLPLSVEVHHALMDGLAVGRYVQAFEALMREPLPWLQGAPVEPLNLGVSPIS